MYSDLNEIEKEKYKKLAKDILKGTFVECKDCSIYGGRGYFISSYKDEQKLEETSEKIYNIMTVTTQPPKK